MNFENIFNLSISTLLALFLVKVFDDEKILSILVVLGQGHFLMSYFYTNKAGKMNSLFRKKFFGLGIVVFAICAFIYQNQLDYFNYLAFFTGVLFVLHYYNDEIKIQDIKRYRLFLIGAVASMASLAGFYADRLFNVPSSYTYILGGISFVLFIYFSFMYIKKEKWVITNNSIYLLFFTFLNCTVPTLLIQNNNVSEYQMFGFIIFFHYFRWYIYYANIFKNDAPSLYFYIKTIFNFHFLLFVLHIQHVITRYNSYLVYIFDPVFFYGWTIMHILLSVRKTDYQ